ncbi:hypothetical protein KY284_022160 [Solanum tuberosum]|nr:hypothetical protein KY284_022160 [Solanum tuberosum]
MNLNNRRSLARSRARARFQAKWVEGTATAGDVAGAVAVAIESGYWWNLIPSGGRQRNVDTMTEILTRHTPVFEQEEVLRLQNIALQFEEEIYNIATSNEDYMRKISLKTRTLEANSQYLINYFDPCVANDGQNAHGPAEMTMEATSYKTTSGPEESDEEQTMEEDDGDVPKEDVVEEVVVTEEQNYVIRHKENEISCGLSSGAKVDERLAQVEEQLEKMEAQSEKVETLLVDINEKLNYLVKMQDAKVSRDIRRPAKYMSSPWTGNGRSKRKRRVAEMIKQSCKH